MGQRGRGRRGPFSQACTRARPRLHWWSRGSPLSVTCWGLVNPRVTDAEILAAGRGGHTSEHMSGWVAAFCPPPPGVGRADRRASSLVLEEARRSWCVLSSDLSGFSLIPHWQVLSDRGSINVPSIFCCVQFYIFFSK